MPHLKPAPHVSTMTQPAFACSGFPHGARIAVRFWHVSTVSDLAFHIRRHFDDLEITHAPYEPEYLPLFRLLKAIAVQGKAENIPPNLAGDTMKSILGGMPYPITLLNASVRRIRVEQAKPIPYVSHARAALIKACLNRYARDRNPNQAEEIAVSLDESNGNIGYRLGRLFAVLERAQEDAAGGFGKLNATIRDRFYGAASTTPATVFPNLMKLKNHHVAKIENRGRAVNLERPIGKIVDGIECFPPLLALADQGRFAIGYHHQRQDFFSKSSDQEGE